MHVIIIYEDEEGDDGPVIAEVRGFLYERRTAQAWREQWMATHDGVQAPQIFRVSPTDRSA